MQIEIINTGSELLLGRVLNTHQQWLCRQLADAGYEVTRQVTVADTGEAIQQAVRESLGRADLVITTGGLGPTADDITRDKIAELLERPLHEDDSVVEHVRSFFARRNRPMPDRTRIQAMIPEGAEIVQNAHGTAPGLIIGVAPNPFRATGDRSVLIMLPGPPRELQPMFTAQILPMIREQFPLLGGFACITLKSTGLGETLMEELLENPLSGLVREGLQVGFCARTGEVDVRFAANGPNSAALVANADLIARKVGAEYIFGTGEESLEQVVVQMLTEAGKTIALAESCTGGYLANRITNVPGASAALVSGMVTYSNESKMDLLGVQKATLEQHGAVSNAVAGEMAEGARARAKSDYAISITGIAGPTGGTTEKPLGTVYIGLASADEIFVQHYLNTFDRKTFKFVTAQQALEMLRRRLTGLIPV